MSNHVGVEKSANIYSVDAQFSQNLVLHIEQHPSSRDVTIHVVEDLDALQPSQAHGIVLLGLSLNSRAGEPESARNSDSEFLSLMRWVAIHKQKDKCKPVILLTARKLSSAQCCLAVKAGIFSVVDFDVTGTAEILWERMQSGWQRNEDIEQQRYRAVPLRGRRAGGMLGSSEAMTRVLEQAYRASQVSDVPVLISGESGTGKQRLAEFIHEHDQKRFGRPFVSVNCAAISGSLAESELFGHQKGAFTGATDSRPGYFRSADGGTILLDEVGELGAVLQPKILRILQESLVRPVGSDQEFKIDVRVIAATNLDLRELVEQNKFRLDLYQRLKVISMTMPPLRQRLSDIPQLFTGFLEKYSHYYSRKISRVDPHVYDVLANSIGSGNIRELENAVRQILVFKEQGETIEISDLPKELLSSGNAVEQPVGQVQVCGTIVDALAQGSKALNEVLDEYEKAILNNLVSRNIQRARLAEHLGVTRRTLYNKLQKHDLL